MNTLTKTLRSATWMRANEQKLKELFPAQWTQFERVNTLGIVYNLKRMGVQFGLNQFGRVMEYLYRVGVYEFDETKTLLKRSHRPFI